LLGHPVTSGGVCRSRTASGDGPAHATPPPCLVVGAGFGVMPLRPLLERLHRQQQDQPAHRCEKEEQLHWPVLDERRGALTGVRSDAPPPHPRRGWFDRWRPHETRTRVLVAPAGVGKLPARCRDFHVGSCRGRQPPGLNQMLGRSVSRAGADAPGSARGQRLRSGAPAEPPGVFAGPAARCPPGSMSRSMMSRQHWHAWSRLPRQSRCAPSSRAGCFNRSRPFRASSRIAKPPEFEAPT
jgi:hypothetical protein